MTMKTLTPALMWAISVSDRHVRLYSKALPTDMAQTVAMTTSTMLYPVNLAASLSYSSSLRSSAKYFLLASLDESVSSATRTPKSTMATTRMAEFR